MSDKSDTKTGAFGIGARLNRHDSRLSELKKRVTKLESRVDTSGEIFDSEAVGKRLKIQLDDGTIHIGIVVAISKFKIKLELQNCPEIVDSEMEKGSTRVFNKGKIRWYQEV